MITVVNAKGRAGWRNEAQGQPEGLVLPLQGSPNLPEECPPGPKQLSHDYQCLCKNSDTPQRRILHRVHLEGRSGRERHIWWFISEKTLGVDKGARGAAHSEWLFPTSRSHLRLNCYNVQWHQLQSTEQSRPSHQVPNVSPPIPQLRDEAAVRSNLSPRYFLPAFPPDA